MQDMSIQIKFRKSETTPDVWVGQTKAMITNIWGRDFETDVILRIDARDGEGKIRVDIADLGMWSAIDGGWPLQTVKEAKEMVKSYLKAVAQHRSLCPPLRSYLSA